MRGRGAVGASPRGNVQLCLGTVRSPLWPSLQDWGQRWGEGSRDHSIIHLKNYAHQHSPKRKSTPGVPTLLVQQAPFCLQNRWPLFGGECCFRGSACSDSCCPLLCAIRLWGQVTALSPPATLSVSHLSISVPGVVPLFLHFINYLIYTHFFFFFWLKQQKFISHGSRLDQGAYERCFPRSSLHKERFDSEASSLAMQGATIYLAVCSMSCAPLERDTVRGVQYWASLFMNTLILPY